MNCLPRHAQVTLRSASAPIWSPSCLHHHDPRPFHRLLYARDCPSRCTGFRCDHVQRTILAAEASGSERGSHTSTKHHSLACRMPDAGCRRTADQWPTSSWQLHPHWRIFVDAGIRHQRLPSIANRRRRFPVVAHLKEVKCWRPLTGDSTCGAVPTLPNWPRCPIGLGMDRATQRRESVPPAPEDFTRRGSLGSTGGP